MILKNQLNRILTELYYDKESVEPKRPEKPYIDEKRPQPKEGQKLLNDSKQN